MSNNNVFDNENKNIECDNKKCYICLEIINDNRILNLKPCECLNMKICLKCLPKYFDKCGKSCTICKSKLVFTKKEKLLLNIKRRKKDKKKKKGHIKKRTKGRRNNRNKGIRRNKQRRLHSFLLVSESFGLDNNIALNLAVSTNFNIYQLVSYSR